MKSVIAYLYYNYFVYARPKVTYLIILRFKNEEYFFVSFIETEKEIFIYLLFFFSRSCSKKIKLNR